MPKFSLPDRNFWIVVAFAVVCGLAAGILGSVASRVYLMQDYFPGEVDLSRLNANDSGLIIRDPKNVTVSSDVKVAETADSLQPVLIGVYKKLPAGKDGYYQLDQPIFTALVITADGWAVAQAGAELKKDFAPADYVAVSSDRHIYEIEKLSALPALPGEPLVFRLANAANLPVKKILTRSELSLGESLLVVTGRRSIWPTTLASLAKGGAVRDSDSLSASLNLSGSGANAWANAFVFDMAGNLAAVIGPDRQAVPAFYYSTLLTDLAQAEPLGRPSLGVRYLDLSAVRLAAEAADRGALLYGLPGQPAVLSGSPAEKAGLVAGDVITWINNQEITAQRDLADIIATYRAGEKITITYRRAGAEKTAEATLGKKL